MKHPVRSTLLSTRLDGYFSLVGPHQQPVIDSNQDPARNHLYQASVQAAEIRDSNEEEEEEEWGDAYGSPQLR